MQETMQEAQIHPLALVEPGAQIGRGVTIEAFAVVKEHVILEHGVTIKSHAYIDGHTTIGEQSTIWPFASVGAKTQDLKFRGERTYVKIGKRCDIRESVTVNASCGAETSVRIGDDCLIMAYCHIAHNCEVGNEVIMANASMLAGHVVVEDGVRIGGMTPVHQFCRIGRYAMVGGFSRVAYDVPPYTIGGGVPYKMGGINLIGLKRRGISLPVRKALSQLFRLVYRSGLSLTEALKRGEADLSLDGEAAEYVRHWLAFCRSTKRGLIGFETLLEEQTPQQEAESSPVANLSRL